MAPKLSSKTLGSPSAAATSDETPLPPHLPISSVDSPIPAPSSLSPVPPPSYVVTRSFVYFLMSLVVLFVFNAVLIAYCAYIVPQRIKQEITQELDTRDQKIEQLKTQLQQQKVLSTELQGLTKKQQVAQKQTEAQLTELMKHLARRRRVKRHHEQEKIEE